MAFTPTLDDLTLLRTWIRGIPLAALPYPATPAVLAQLAILRQQLHLKATRLQQPDSELWLKRQPQAAWERQALASLNKLIPLNDIIPHPHHPISYWFPPALSAPLANHHLNTLADIIATYQRQGAGWWQTLPGLGRINARHIEKTLEGLLPGRLTYQPITPVLRYETGLVPLERFLLPTHLDGSRGRNRSPEAPFIPLAHDLAAIEAWLYLYDPASHTHRNYRREAERLLLWAIMSQKKALSSVDATDLATYRSFLHDPQPATDWVGPPQRKQHCGWKPFTGPLSLRSIRHAETILNRLFDFLVRQCYWQHNPLSVLPRLKSPTGQGTLAVHRAFSPAQWTRITTAADHAVQNDTGQTRRKGLRTQFILQLAYATGLRLSELTQATVGDVITVERQGQTQTWLSVLGKGQKLRQVPLPPQTWALLMGYYRTLTGRELRQQPAETPLIADLHDSRKTVTPLAIHKVLKGFFTALAAHCETDDPEAASQLLKASAHWLRHTHGSVAVAQNIPLVMIRDNLGHASIATTSQYLHAEADARFKAFEHFTDTRQKDKRN